LAFFTLFFGAYFLAFLLRFDFDIPSIEGYGFSKALPALIIIKLVAFGYFGLFRGLWQYVSADDVVLILKANVIASLGFVGTVAAMGWLGFPRSVFLLDFILCLGMTTSLRFSLKFLKDLTIKRGISLKDHDILIVGAGDAGVMLFQEIRRNPSMGRVVGFIDDDRKKQFETIRGVHVLGGRKDIPRVVRELGVDEIILAVPSATGAVVRDILSYCEQTKANIRVVPGLDRIITGEMEVKPRAVQPEDLLGRETVRINTDEIRHYITGKVVLVTGAGGSIGSEICRQIAAFSPAEIILFDHHENYVYFLTVEFKSKHPDIKVSTVIGDIRDVGLLKQLFSKKRPQVVFHAAAHKHVPLMEESPTAAVKNNIFGTRNMIYASSHYGVERFVQISTDKAVNPVNVMGMSKRVAEIILQSRARAGRTKFMAVRFGNVLGSAGSVVPLFKRQIESGGPVTVTHPDVKRYFMSIKEAVMLVLQAGAMGKGGELFILDMGEQIKVVEIAKNLIALSGFEVGKDIEIKFTGLRPGEKLEEELLLDKEQDVVTQHNKIFVSHNGLAFDRKTLHHDLKRLHRLSQIMDAKGIMHLLEKIITAGNK
jgi:FlaA1/EpsC-like NDP-sugar epimerase